MIFISERADVIFGYSSQELQENIGLIANVIHPDDILTPSQSLEIFRKNNNFRRIQYRAKDKTSGFFLRSELAHLGFGNIRLVIHRRTGLKMQQHIFVQYYYEHHSSFTVVFSKSSLKLIQGVAPTLAYPNAPDIFEQVHLVLLE